MPRDPMKKLVVRSLPGRPEHRVAKNRKFRGRHLFLILIAALAVFFGYKKYHVYFGVSADKTATNPVASVTEIPPLQSSPAAPGLDTDDKFEIRHQYVRGDDSMAKILEQFDLSKDYIAEWQKACKPAPFGGMREGDELIFFIGRPDRRLLKVFYSAAAGPTLALRRTSEGWECQAQEAAPRSPVRTVRFKYAENFYDSCIAGGLPANLIANLADIFAYDVDFNSDFKDGDAFSIFYQEQGIEGAECGQYLILAAEVNVSGRTYQAFGFQVPDEGWEYFDAKGMSLRRAFLRSPLSLRRMLSPSSYKNVKPVIKLYRSHFGIDYSTQKGTPVSAVGDGVITALNKKGRSAILIEIRHRGGYRSLYGNLSGFSRGLNRGGIVSQGEVIGTVGAGASGKSFLNFHFLKNSKPVNFHSTDFQRAISIPKTMRAEFEKTRDSYTSVLQGKTSQIERQSGRQ